VQPAPQRHSSPQPQVSCFAALWQPHAQLAPGQALQRQVVSFWSFMKVLRRWGG
jgi:hypothetical protein